MSSSVNIRGCVSVEKKGHLVVNLAIKERLNRPLQLDSRLDNNNLGSHNIVDNHHIKYPVF